MDEDLTQFERIVEFNRISGQELNEVAQFPSEDTLRLKIKNINDEFVELLEAIQHRDLDNVAKEACDLIYVIDGLLASCGINRDAALEEVHESNMSKYTMDKALANQAVYELNQQHGKGSFVVGNVHPWYCVLYNKGEKRGKVCKEIPCYFPADMSKIVWTEERIAEHKRQFAEVVFKSNEDPKSN